MAQCATTALAGAVPRPCVRGACGRFGGLGPVPGVVSLPFPPSRPACLALLVAGRPVWVSLTLARWYAIPSGLCVPRARSNCPSGSPRVPFACVCARAPAASAPPPTWVVWRAHLARSRPWALVGPFHVVRAPARVLPRSLAPSGVLGGGRSGPGSPLPGLACTPRGGCLPRGWWGAVPGGGLACHCCEGCMVSGAVPPPTARPLGWAAVVPRPYVPGAVSVGVGTRHQFHSVRPCGRGCSLLGWRRGVPGGVAFHRCEGRLRSGAPPPRLPAHWAGCWGPPPTCRGRECVVVGAQHCPPGLHALWGPRAAGVVGGRPPGGWPATVVRGVWCQALSLPRLPVLWGGQPGFRDPCVPGAVDAGAETQHRPHSVRPCGPALLAVGVA